MELRQCASYLALAACVAGCSGGAVTPSPAVTSSSFSQPTATPQATATPRATATPAPTATPSPVQSGMLGIAAVNSALQGVETYYLTLPHSNLETDLNALAAHMTSSGAYETAIVTAGGVSATLPDGSHALVFADRAEDVGGPAAAARSREARARDAMGVGPGTGLSPPTAHEVAFLINTVDTSGAFTPGRQTDFGNAFTNLGFAKAGDGVDVLDISLDNIVALGSGHPLDFLDIATHGIVGGFPNQSFYANLSTTPITDATLVKYASDWTAGRIDYAIYLWVEKTGIAPLPSWAFTPAFLTTHLTFNPGAIVDNQSCFGQNPLIASAVGATLRSAGVGRYFGWTKAVQGIDADQTDAFLLDRMLGEQSPSVTGLDLFADERTPPQRPFGLDQIEPVMATEQRTGPLGAVAEPYAISNGGGTNALYPPIADGPNARYLASDFGGESVTNPPIEYALPSIARLQTREFSKMGALQIDGVFPKTQGSVTIANAAGTYTAVPVSWTTSAILVPIPDEGAGSSGLVQIAGDGIQSNPVPLTQWHGGLTYTEHDTIGEFDNTGGNGTGSLQAVFSVNVRADVHPTVVTIDQTPQPQNLAFSGFEPDSSGAVTAFGGTFTAQVGGSASFGLAAAPPTMAPFGSAASMSLTPVASQPAPCNNALQGPQANAGDVFCPALTFSSMNVGTCTVTSGKYGLCDNPSVDSPSGQFGRLLGANPGVPDGLLKLKMNPVTYAVAVSSSPSPLISTNNFDGSDVIGNANVTGTFEPPLSPPSAKTPAFRFGW